MTTALHLVGFSDRAGALVGRFEDGTEVSIHKHSQRHVFYVLKPFNLEWLHYPTPAPDVQRAYQWLAIEGFLSGQPADVSVDEDQVWTVTPRSR